MKNLIVLQHIKIEDPGYIKDLMIKDNVNLTTIELDEGDKIPEDLSNYDAMFCMGGPMDTWMEKDYPWLIEEIGLIKEALNQGVGIIGVCLGAQLLAYAAGGDVEMIQEEVSHQPLAEIGWDNIFPQSLENHCKLTRLLGYPFPVLHWHGDRILLPNTAELIASSCRCKEQLFSIGSLAYGLQFHVEIDDEMVNTWISEDQKFISSALGTDGQSILKQQQKEFGRKTLVSRLEFLNILFDQLS